ncbi:transcriptional regulator [Streptomyces sp. CB02923]|uniref:helix-turn-helix domain-containing protein n=1 Tax=Streptomyces sp. CB02923 TaxID=1718985 RepID=UPI00094020ED|nr:helix-turn-helix transcriptional regulator [Streptomyces sp. CB02923]OKI00226.1 transcriptional regulator [Streptomyces sp. CB02923]
MDERGPDEEESAREVLARELRRLREVSGRSLSELADEAKYDRTYLNRLENGERLSRRDVMVSLDRIYGTGKLLVGLWVLARRSAFLDRFKLFMQYEAKAVIMHKYLTVMPGLLQTEEYARALLSSAPTPISATLLEDRVAARLGRQELLVRTPAPIVRFILDEAVLRRPMAGPGVWHGQLGRLLEAAEAPNIALQVLPFTAGSHDLMGGSLTLLWMDDGKAVAYLEGNKSGDLIEDTTEVTQHRVSYDRLRDMSLSLTDSVALIQQVMEASSP